MAKTQDERNSHAGYHPFASELGDHGSFEVFWFEPLVIVSDDDCWTNEDGETYPAGWYWWACFPGCLPDGGPCGPFGASRTAYRDAREES